MPRVNCAFCGLPFSVRAVHEGAQNFCCSGCALASRIPVHGDALPISRGLILALALGFGLFNELLFAVAGTAIVAEGRADVGATWMLVSVIIGGMLGGTNLVFLATARPWRWSDGVAGGIAVASMGWAITSVVGHGVSAALWPTMGANLWWAAWWSRGWLRRALARWRHRG